MSRGKIRVSVWAALLWAFLYDLSDPAVLAALLLPAAVHELGHVAALRLMGLRIDSLRLELKGFCIGYSGYTGAMGHALAALCGPVAGLWYAWAASWLGNRLGSSWLCLSAGVSLLLSLFNLLPAMPLDGGRILDCLARALLGERRGALLTEGAGLLVGGALLAAGLWLMFEGWGAALAVAALWMLLYQENERGLVNGGELL